MFLYPNGNGGNAYFYLRASPGGAPLLTQGPVPIDPSLNSAFELYSDWTGYALQPNTTYFWQMRYITGGGTIHNSAEQTFTTPAANTTVVGTGTAASCTGAAFASAMASGIANVTFNCGTAPVSIQTTGETVIGSSRTVDGDRLITLVGAANQRIFRQTAGTSTLTGLTLTGGSSTTCGGAVIVQGGTMNITESVLTQNQSGGSGGGVCVDPPASLRVTKSALRNNTAATNGGAAYSSGLAQFYETDFSNNTAGTRGGALSANSGALDVIGSSIISNTSPTGTGGGIGTFGTANVVAHSSTLSGNSAQRGAAVHHAGNLMVLTSDTIAHNTSSAAGRGAIESDIANPNFGQIANTIICANTPANCSASALQFCSLSYNIDSGSTCGFSGVPRSAESRPAPAATWIVGRHDTFIPAGICKPSDRHRRSPGGGLLRNNRPTTSRHRWRAFHGWQRRRDRVVRRGLV